MYMFRLISNLWLKIEICNKIEFRKNLPGEVLSNTDSNLGPGLIDSSTNPLIRKGGNKNNTNRGYYERSNDSYSEKKVPTEKKNIKRTNNVPLSVYVKKLKSLLREEQKIKFYQRRWTNETAQL